MGLAPEREEEPALCGEEDEHGRQRVARCGHHHINGDRTRHLPYTIGLVQDCSSTCGYVGLCMVFHSLMVRLVAPQRSHAMSMSEMPAASHIFVSEPQRGLKTPGWLSSIRLAFLNHRGALITIQNPLLALDTCGHHPDAEGRRAERQDLNEHPPEHGECWVPWRVRDAKLARAAEELAVIAPGHGGVHRQDVDCHDADKEGTACQQSVAELLGVLRLEVNGSPLFAEPHWLAGGAICSRRHPDLFQALRGSHRGRIPALDPRQDAFGELRLIHGKLVTHKAVRTRLWP